MAMVDIKLLVLFKCKIIVKRFIDKQTRGIKYVWIRFEIIAENSE